MGSSGSNGVGSSARISSSLWVTTLGHRVPELDGVGEVRSLGLMAGIELDPPGDGPRWGRRVAAGCVERGVLIRPLGDVVVTVPMLTSTEDEIDRIVDTLVAAITDVCG